MGAVGAAFGQQGVSAAAVGLLIDRAIAAGPDWQDAATAGVLLGLMPDAVMRRAWPDLNAVCQRDGWAVLVKSGLIREVSQTRNESIARAYLASKGAM